MLNGSSAAIDLSTADGLRALDVIQRVSVDQSALVKCLATDVEKQTMDVRSCYKHEQENASFNSQTVTHDFQPYRLAALPAHIGF